MIEISRWVVMLIALFCLIVGYAIGQTVGFFKMYHFLRSNMKEAIHLALVELKLEGLLGKALYEGDTTIDFKKSK